MDAALLQLFLRYPERIFQITLRMPSEVCAAPVAGSFHFKPSLDFRVVQSEFRSAARMTMLS
jgi:hypothetical protein